MSPQWVLQTAQWTTSSAVRPSIQVRKTRTSDGVISCHDKDHRTFCCNVKLDSVQSTLRHSDEADWCWAHATRLSGRFDPYLPPDSRRTVLVCVDVWIRWSGNVRRFQVWMMMSELFTSWTSTTNERGIHSWRCCLTTGNILTLEANVSWHTAVDRTWEDPTLTRFTWLTHISFTAASCWDCWDAAVWAGGLGTCWNTHTSR